MTPKDERALGRREARPDGDGGPWFSATQIETFDLCPRKWAFKSVDRIPVLEKPSAALGTAVHGQLEAWLSAAQPLDLTVPAGEIALSGLAHLPAPQTPGLEIEQWFGVTLGGHRFRGKKDWQRLGLDVPEVGDHKTTRDFKWIKTPDELRVNVQAAIYAADAMLRTGKTEVDLRWVYYRTSGARKSQVVHLRITKDDITPILARACESAQAMTDILRAGLRAKDLPYNVEACSAFGGCEFVDHCGLTPAERFNTMAEQTKITDWLSKMQARGINPPGPAPTAMPAPPVGPPASFFAPPAGPPPVSAAPPERAQGPDVSEAPKPAKRGKAPATTTAPAELSPLTLAIKAAARAFIEALEQGGA